MVDSNDLIIRSKIKNIVKDMSVAGDVSLRLNERVIEILEKGAERAKANGRRTLQGKDL